MEEWTKQNMHTNCQLCTCFLSKLLAKGKERGNTAKKIGFDTPVSCRRRATPQGYLLSQ